ncbi:MAG: hypothetical protein AAFP77_13195 [Bacteroidota bacterium]
MLKTTLMFTSFRLFTVVFSVLLAHCSLHAQSTAEERIQWIYPNEFTYTSFDRNTDTASTDYLINLYFSGPQGTYYHETMTSEVVHYDYQISPWTQLLESRDMILIKTDQGLAFANREGEILRQTSYQKVKAIPESSDYFQGSSPGSRRIEVFSITTGEPRFEMELAEGESITYEGQFFKLSGYGLSTRFYDTNGKLVLEEAEHTMTALATDEPRFFVQDNRFYRNWLADEAGNKLADLPKQAFSVVGEGDRVMVQLGAFKKLWVDLSGERISSTVAQALLPGEMDVLHNCGTPGKMGARFHASDITLPCEYDGFGLAWPDSSVIQAKKYTVRTYFRRNGELYFDPGSQTVSRYLGHGYFVVGKREGCAFMNAEVQILVQTEVPVSDATGVANADYYPGPQGGLFIIAPKYGRKMMVYDTSGQLLFTYASADNRSLRWAVIGDNIRITEGTESFIVDRQGKEVETVRYRNPEYIYRDGQLKFIITNQIYPGKADISRGMDGLLDGVATYLVDAETDEILLSSNTGMEWIDEEHLLLYFGRTTAVVKVKY